MLPNFIVIGAMNAGTTSLYRYLSAHPQVFMCDPKEPEFFASEEKFEGKREWYERLFDPAGGVPALGEGSVVYSMYPVFDGVPERIASLLPDVRLIYLVRDPIERMRTQYLQYRYPKRIEYEFERERKPFHEALLTSPLYVNSSRYALQIEQYLKYFGPEQFLIIKSEDLRHARARTIQRILEFLGVDSIWESPVLNQEFHRSADRRVPRPMIRRLRNLPGYSGMTQLIPPGWKRFTRSVSIQQIDPDKAAPMDNDLRRQLVGLLRDDVKKLRAYIGDDFDGWGIA
jgi:hypothetical protein